MTIESFLRFIYPPICMHCRQPIAGKATLFCESCASFFELLNPKEHCPTCFGMGVCDPRCTEIAQKQLKVAACFDYLEGVQTFVRAFKQNRMPYLAKTAACWMAMQFYRLGWPTPALIIPIPPRGVLQLNHPLIETARSLAKLLGTQYDQPLGRKRGKWKQSRLTRAARLQLPLNTFYCKKPIKIHSSSILLIDDVMTSKRTLECALFALSKYCNQPIYALTVAQTIYIK